MQKLPKDPVSSRQYFYRSDNLSYQLYARLENTQDSQLISPSGTDCGGGVACNYGISSSNTKP